MLGLWQTKQKKLIGCIITSDYGVLATNHIQRKKKKRRTKDKTITTVIYLGIPYTHFRGQILR